MLVSGALQDAVSLTLGPYCGPGPQVVGISTHSGADKAVTRVA